MWRKGGSAASSEDKFDRLMNELARLGAQFTLAVDGTAHRTIDSICVNPEVKHRIKVAMRVLLRHNVLFWFVTAILRQNLREVVEVQDLASRLGLRRCVIFGYSPTGRGREVYGQFMPSPEEFERVLGEIADHVIARRWRHLVYVYEAGIVCRIGEYLCIDSQGNVIPCLFARVRFGSALDDELDDVYSEMTRFFSAIRRPEKLRGRCRACRYRYVCGGCRVRAHELKGDWLEEDPLCSYVPS